MKSLRVVLVGATKEEVDKAIAAEPISSKLKFSPAGMEGKLEFTILPYAVGSASLFPAGDVLFLHCFDLATLDLLDPVMGFCSKMPIKFMMYKGVPPKKEFHEKWGFKVIEPADPKKLLAEIVEANNQLTAMIESVFKNFDKDHSGFIDLKEIIMMSRELKNPIPEGEAELILKDLDTNKDGKVSLEEFTNWWKAGRRGVNARLSSMVIGNIKKTEALQKAAEVLAQYGGMEDIKEEDKKLIQVAAAFHLNRTKETGLILNAHMCTAGKQLEEINREHRMTVGAPKDLPYLCLSFTCKHPEKVKGLLENLVSQAYAMVSMMSPEISKIIKEEDIGFSFDEKKATFRLTLRPQEIPGVEREIKKAEKVKGLMLPDQEFDAYLRLKTDLGKLATTEKPVFAALLDGVSVELKGTITKAVLKEASRGTRGLMREIKGGGGMFNFAKGTLELEIDDEEVKEMMKKFGIPPIPLKDIKAMLAPMILGNLEMMPELKEMYNMVSGELSGIELFICQPGLVGFKFLADLPHLDMLLKLE
jgi:hypothetical protein